MLRNNDNRCWVYIAVAPHAVKVGMTQDLERRRKAIEAAAGCPVTISDSLQFPTRAAARRVEKAILQRFAHHRRYGEWFTGVPASDVIAAAKEEATEFSNELWAIVRRSAA